MDVGSGGIAGEPVVDRILAGVDLGIVLVGRDSEATIPAVVLAVELRAVPEVLGADQCTASPVTVDRG